MVCSGFMDTLRMPVLGNAPSQWFLALLLATGFLVVLSLARRIIATKLKAFAANTSTELDDVIAEALERTHFLFLLSMALYVSTWLLELGKFAVYAKSVMVVAFLLQVGRWSSTAMNCLIKQWQSKRIDEPAMGTTFTAFSLLGRFLIWIVVLLLIMDNLGIRVASLLTGLGVGGIAVALAVQKILGDLFASISIMMDKPFEIGDFILVGDMLGTVEHIGLKTTRVRSLSGEQLVFSNADLLGSRIRNYKRMSERRVVFSLGVTYQTPLERLRAIPDWIKGIIESQEKVRFDRAHFQKFGDSALVYEVVYWISDPDYNLYMDIQQAINLAIAEAFANQKVEFAYPTQTLHIAKLS